MKQPWQAKIIHKNRDVNLIFPDQCRIVKDTIEEVLEELLKTKHKAFYEVDRIILKRYYGSRKRKRPRKIRMPDGVLLYGTKR